MLIGCVVELPFVAFQVIPSSLSQSAPFVQVLVSLGIGILLYTYYRVYYFFLPVFGGKRNFAQIMHLSFAITKEKKLLPLLPFFLCAGCLALGLALSEAILFSLPSFWKNFASIFWSALGGMLVLYVTLAVAVREVPWSRLQEFSPSEDFYVRLQSLAAWKIPWLSFLLDGKRSLILFFASVLLWSGTLARSITTHPGFDLRMVEMDIKDFEVGLKLELKDDRGELSSVHPVFFRIAGKDGEVFSEKLSQVLVNGKEQSMYAPLPNQSPAVIELRFQVPRKKQDTQALKDLALWYRGVQLEPLIFEKMFEI
jgi:hypothetical protein